jgi:ABC-type polysaccharide/polyol phosphate transport system ATPase subunit
MKVRLAFSLAIKIDADILLLDEVLAVGDAGFQEKCFEVFKNFKSRGKTIVFVSHDLESVKKFSTRAMYLKDGCVEMIGHPGEAVQCYLGH